MKIKKIQLRDHPVLKNIKVDFSNFEGKAEDIIIIAGSNGSGKTNLLEAIFNCFIDISVGINKNEVEIEFEIDEITIIHDKYLEKNDRNSNNIDLQKLFYELINKSALEKFKKPPKIVYMPTEINFSYIKSVNDKFKYAYSFLNEIGQNTIECIPSYIATKVKLLQKEDEKLTYKEVKEKVSNEVNSIFESLELDIKMIGFTPDERDLPLFKNLVGDTFDINQLSSGEKQIFMRALTLKMVEAENSIILIDEPEISLHPKWQQKIVKMYRNIGKNNQIIIATHSPLIISSVPNTSVRVAKRTPKGIEISRHDELTFGQTIETILEDVMELENSIVPEIAEKIEKLHKMILNNEYKEEKFKKNYEDLKKLLGNHNEKLVLLDIDLEIARRRGEKNVQSK